MKKAEHLNPRLLMAQQFAKALAIALENQDLEAAGTIGKALVGLANENVREHRWQEVERQAIENEIDREATARLLGVAPTAFETLAPAEEVVRLLELMDIQDKTSLEARRVAYTIACHTGGRLSGGLEVVPDWLMKSADKDQAFEDEKALLQAIAAKNPVLTSLLNERLDAWNEK